MGEAWHEYVPDRGCDLFVRCLSCPLPVCRYEMKAKQARTIINQIRVIGLLRQGRTVEQTAVQMGLSRRSVFRLSVEWRAAHTFTAVGRRDRA